MFFQRKTKKKTRAQDLAEVSAEVSKAKVIGRVQFFPVDIKFMEFEKQSVHHLTKGVQPCTDDNLRRAVRSLERREDEWRF